MDESLRVPAWCPVCQNLMKGRSTGTYYQYDCCIQCFIEWVEGREQKWKDGWRPSKEQIKDFIDKIETT